MKNSIIKGFSKLGREEKIEALKLHLPDANLDILNQVFTHQEEDVQRVVCGLSENTLSLYQMPYSIAPNFLINNQLYHLPMVTEESSVVAAASWAARYWSDKGGFLCKVLGTTKKGQVHFFCNHNSAILISEWEQIKTALFQSAAKYTKNMVKRGGGISDIQLIDKTNELDGYFQLDLSFETADAMGANFINSCLESIAKAFESMAATKYQAEVDIIMSILSNHNPDCIVECSVVCTHDALDMVDGTMPYAKFIGRYEKAVHIAQCNIDRAVTHNKGIMNGVDAVLIATGNDFRAVEAGVHAYASLSGNYKAIGQINTSGNYFSYSITLPLTLGTTGGVTSLHPMAKQSLDMLGRPSAKQLMAIVASAGMANNFSAIKALVTKGIQYGHMKMHLKNILNKLGVSTIEQEKAEQYFNDKVISYADVDAYIKSIR